MIKYVVGGWLVINLALVAILGFRGQISPNRPLMLLPDMDYQPKYTTQAKSEFFADGRTMRVPPEGTIPYGGGGGDYAADAGAIVRNADFLQADPELFEGKTADGQYVAVNPLFARAETEEERLALLQRGRQRYEIFCAVCHGSTGNGKGITTEYGMQGVANYHTDYVRNQPDGQIYNTITHGKGTMMPYGHAIRPRDRWAIVAYIRALQLSRGVQLAGPSTGTTAPPDAESAAPSGDVPADGATLKGESTSLLSPEASPTSMTTATTSEESRKS